MRPYPKIVKARHMKLSVDGPAHRSPTEVDEAPYEPRKKQSAQLPKTSLKSFSRNDEPDLFETVKAPIKRVTISNANAEATAVDVKSKQVLQQYQDVIFKPRRAITKSLDFNATAANMRLRNSGNQTQLEGVALPSTQNKFNATAYGSIGSRFSGNNHVSLRMGTNASPPRMVAYRPNMRETDLVANLDRYISNVDVRSSVHNGSPTKVPKHTTKNANGFNDVSRYTWSSV
jgi:hypothetical protein